MHDPRRSVRRRARPSKAGGASILMRQMCHANLPVKEDQPTNDRQNRYCCSAAGLFRFGAGYFLWSDYKTAKGSRILVGAPCKNSAAAAKLFVGK